MGQYSWPDWSPRGTIRGAAEPLGGWWAGPLRYRGLTVARCSLLLIGARLSYILRIGDIASRASRAERPSDVLPPQLRREPWIRKSLLRHAPFDRSTAAMLCRVLEDGWDPWNMAPLDCHWCRR